MSKKLHGVIIITVVVIVIISRWTFWREFYITSYILMEKAIIKTQLYAPIVNALIYAGDYYV